jgi:hypothetical protein
MVRDQLLQVHGFYDETTGACWIFNHGSEKPRSCTTVFAGSGSVQRPVAPATHFSPAGVVPAYTVSANRAASTRGPQTFA